MIQEDKELLLKDLSARLPYGVIMNTPNGDGYLNSINQTIFGNEYGINIKSTRRDYFNDEKINFKPYLRSISSMTKKEKEEFNYIRDIVAAKFINAVSKNGFTLAYYDLIDWLNAHHFDYRGLIGAGLALEAPKGMYNIKEK